MKQKKTHRFREQTYGCREVRGRIWGEGMVRESWMAMYTLLYLKWITNKDLPYSTGTLVQCYVAAWMGGEFGKEWVYVYVYVYVWLSCFAVHLKLSQYC